MSELDFKRKTVYCVEKRLRGARVEAGDKCSSCCSHPCKDNSGLDQDHSGEGNDMFLRS